MKLLVSTVVVVVIRQRSEIHLSLSLSPTVGDYKRDLQRHCPY